MAAAAILDFTEIEFWRQNGLWSIVFSPCVKFCANMCHSDRNVAIKQIFKMAASVILNLLPPLFLAYRGIWIVVLYVPVNFCKSNSTGGWVIKFCKKFKMTAVRHLELLCSNAGPPSKSNWRPETCVQISCWLFCIFQDIVNRNFCKFGLKLPFGPPEFTFLGVLTPKHYFSSSRPPKGTALAENTSYESSCVVISPAVWPGRRVKDTRTKKKGRTKTVENWVFAPPTPLIRS